MHGTIPGSTCSTCCNSASSKVARYTQEHVYQGRMHSILSNIRTHKPEVVLMYCMNNINKLKKSVQDFFDGAKFKMIKATIPPDNHR